MTIRIKRGLEADILLLNLPLGEPVWATDTNRMFVGTGAGVAPVKINLDDLVSIFNVANGLLKLDGAGLIPTNLLPGLAITTPYAVADIPARDALTPETGDVAIVASTAQTFIFDGTVWLEIIAPSGVSSVNGQTGAVTLALDQLTDVAATTPSIGQVLTFDGTNWTALSIPAGVTQFTQLSDVPSTFTNFAGQLVRVNATETELEYTNEIDGGTV